MAFRSVTVSSYVTVALPATEDYFVATGARGIGDDLFAGIATT